MNNEELAYIAGFFDGEGSITIHINGRNSPRGLVPNHTLQVSIGNTDPRVLKWLKDNFGGSLLYRKGATPHHRNIAQWCVRTRKALLFLNEIFPFIRMKTEQVRVAIEYQKTKKLCSKAIVPEVVKWREEQRQLIRQLNAKEWIGKELVEQVENENPQG